MTTKANLASLRRLRKLADQLDTMAPGEGTRMLQCDLEFCIATFELAIDRHEDELAEQRIRALRRLDIAFRRRLRSVGAPSAFSSPKAAGQ